MRAHATETKVIGIGAQAVVAFDGCLFVFARARLAIAQGSRRATRAAAARTFNTVTFITGIFVRDTARRAVDAQIAAACPFGRVDDFILRFFEHRAHVWRLRVLAQVRILWLVHASAPYVFELGRTRGNDSVPPLPHQREAFVSAWSMRANRVHEGRFRRASVAFPARDIRRLRLHIRRFHGAGIISVITELILFTVVTRALGFVRDGAARFDHRETVHVPGAVPARRHRKLIPRRRRRLHLNPFGVTPMVARASTTRTPDELHAAHGPRDVIVPLGLRHPARVHDKRNLSRPSAERARDDADRVCHTVARTHDGYARDGDGGDGGERAPAERGRIESVTFGCWRSRIRVVAFDVGARRGAVRGARVAREGHGARSVASREDVLSRSARRRMRRRAGARRLASLTSAGKFPVDIPAWNPAAGFDDVRGTLACGLCIYTLH